MSIRLLFLLLCVSGITQAMNLFIKEKKLILQLDKKMLGSEIYKLESNIPDTSDLIKATLEKLTEIDNYNFQYRYKSKHNRTNKYSPYNNKFIKSGLTFDLYIPKILIHPMAVENVLPESKIKKYAADSTKDLTSLGDLKNILYKLSGDYCCTEQVKAFEEKKRSLHRKECIKGSSTLEKNKCKCASIQKQIDDIKNYPKKLSKNNLHKYISTIKTIIEDATQKRNDKASYEKDLKKYQDLVNSQTESGYCTIL